MPLNTAVPNERRISDPAPVASTSGTTPRMKANEVIVIGRRRSRDASTAASARDFRDPHPRQGAKKTHRHHQNDREGHRPTFIERRQGQKNAQHRQGEDKK